MKKQVIALKVHNGKITVEGIPNKMKLPDGCMGICFVFESKKAAKEYWGNDVPMIEVEYENTKKGE